MNPQQDQPAPGHESAATQGLRSRLRVASRTRGFGVASVVVSAASTQIGAGVGVLAMPTLGAPGVVAMRQLVGACVLLPIARPPIRSLRWRQWWPVLMLSISLATMNLLVYAAFGRINLALAVTLEFVGPLMLGVLGSRSRADFFTALAAGLGVYVLVLPGPTSDYLGVAMGLGAGIAWALYIIASRIAGQRLPGVQGSALAMGCNALFFAPILVAMFSGAIHGAVPWVIIGYALVAGALSSAIPYALDLLALRRVPTPMFGVLMSLHPVCAALSGLLVLGQVLAAHEWIGMIIIVTANAINVGRPRRR